MGSGACSGASARPQASNSTSLSHIDLISSCLALPARGYGMPSNMDARTHTHTPCRTEASYAPAPRRATATAPCLHVHKRARNACFHAPRERGQSGGMWIVQMFVRFQSVCVWGGLHH